MSGAERQRRCKERELLGLIGPRLWLHKGNLAWFLNRAGYLREEDMDDRAAIERGLQQYLDEMIAPR